MNLRTFLPFDRFKLLTKLAPKEVRDRIESITQPRKAFHLFSVKGGKPYQGKLEDDSFEISRIISGRNSFLPIIKGHISDCTGQTEITIRMRPIIAVLVFMTIWLGVIGSVCVGILIGTLRHFKELTTLTYSPAALFPFGLFAFGYSLLILSYRTESRKSRAFLKKCLEAEEIEP